MKKQEPRGRLRTVLFLAGAAVLALAIAAGAFFVTRRREVRTQMQYSTSAGYEETQTETGAPQEKNDQKKSGAVLPGGGGGVELTPEEEAALEQYLMEQEGSN